MSGVAAAGGAAAAAAAAAIAQAIKASGAIVKIEPNDFQNILARQKDSLVVVAQSRFFGTKYKYLTSYKGLFFYTQSRHPIELPGDCEVIQSQKIWIPG